MQNYTEEKNAGLLHYMLDHRHGTPFEHTMITYRVTLPLFVVQQMLRHRVGVSPNMESQRYKAPDFVGYVPKKWRKQAKSNRQSSVFTEWEPGLEDQFSAVVAAHHAESARIYRWLIASGVAREQARIVIPHGFYTSGYFTFNMRSLLHFQSLRDKPDAQWEIQQVAKAMATLVEDRFPLTFNAWRKLNVRSEEETAA